MKKYIYFIASYVCQWNYLRQHVGMFGFLHYEVLDPPLPAPPTRPMSIYFVVTGSGETLDPAILSLETPSEN